LGDETFALARRSSASLMHLQPIRWVHNRLLRNVVVTIAAFNVNRHAEYAEAEGDFDCWGRVVVFAERDDREFEVVGGGDLE